MKKLIAFVSSALFNLARICCVLGLLTLGACNGGGGGGGGGSNSNAAPTSNNWDSLIWDQGNWG